MRKCIDAVLRQSYKTVTVIILDNNSVDDIDQIIKHYDKKIVFIKSRLNYGFGGGHNRIIQSVQLQKQDYYLALNPDATLDSNCVKALVEGARKHRADWATGKLYKDFHTNTLYSVGHAILRDGYAFNIGHECKDEGQYSDVREVFGAAGAAALYKGSMIQAVSVSGNFFDPALFMYYEDVDVDWRARLLGLHCWFIPNAIVHHRGGLFPSHLEAGVLVNRFVSVVKNAYWIDLVVYNAPIILLHTIIRLIITPKVGVQIILQLFRSAQYALFHRTQSKISRSDLLAWFARSVQEDSGVPITHRQRMFAFSRRHNQK